MYTPLRIEKTGKGHTGNMVVNIISKDDILIAVTNEDYANFIATCCNSYDALIVACKTALADLEGIMPVFEPSGDRLHPAWLTIKELKAAIRLTRVRR